MSKLGHEVKLIAPQYVRPFIKRQKTDMADAEAIVIAAQRPEMRFVEPKSEDQQARAVLFRSRERLVHQRTELANALRAVLYEYGHTVPPGIGHLKRIEATLDEPNSGLPALVREECRDMMAQIAEKTARIEVRTKRAAELAASADTAKRLQTMPGVGPLTALAVDAFAPDMKSFRRGRDFAAWLGLVPCPPHLERWHRLSLEQGSFRGLTGQSEKEREETAELERAQCSAASSEVPSLGRELGKAGRSPVEASVNHES